MNERLREMLEQLSRSLFDAISESEDVHEHLRQLREEGYSLNLLLDCQPEDEAEDEPGEARDPAEEDERIEEETVRASVTRSSQASRRSRSRSGSPPVFRIDGNDLAFLRDLGIDPTRRCKSKSQKRRLPSERLADET